MSKRIGIGGDIALAFGFAWQPIDPLESAGTQRKQLIAQGMCWEASFKTTSNKDQVEFIGASKDDFSPIKGVTTVAGAAQMALHPRLSGRTVFVIMEDAGPDPSSSIVAVVGLINGNIVIDDYTSVQQLGRLRTEYRDKVSRHNKQFDVVGQSITLGTLSETYSWDDFRPVKAAPFSKKKGVPAVKVKSLDPKVPAKAIWACFGAIAIMGGVWAYTDYSEKQEAMKSAERARQLQNSGPTRYAKTSAELLDQPFLQANSVFSVLRDALKDFPIERKGWRLEKIYCAPDGRCRATWGNYLGLANYRDFVEDVPKEWGAIELNNKGESLSHWMPIRLPQSHMQAKSKWPVLREFLGTGFSEWQKYWVLGFHPELGGDAAVMAVPPGVDARAVAEYPDAIWAIAWNMKQTPWYLSEVFDKSVEKIDANVPDSMTVENITVKVEKDRSVIFDAEGKIYVRK